MKQISIWNKLKKLKTKARKEGAKEVLTLLASLEEGLTEQGGDQALLDRAQKEYELRAPEENQENEEEQKEIEALLALLPPQMNSEAILSWGLDYMEGSDRLNRKISVGLLLNALKNDKNGQYDKRVAKRVFEEMAV